MVRSHVIAGSSKGRTADSESVNRGSIPCPAACGSENTDTSLTMKNLCTRLSPHLFVIVRVASYFVDKERYGGSPPTLVPFSSQCFARVLERYTKEA